jgi:MFS family permease
MTRARHDPYAAFRQIHFRRYLIGWIAALVGTRIQSVAVGWEIYQRTGQALALGFVGLAQALPMILLALPAGYLADRFDRRRIVMLSVAGMAVASLGLAALSLLHGPVLFMYLLLVFDASSLSLGRPARLAMLPHLVDRETFPNAVTWNSSMFEIASVLGPVVAGFIVAIHVPSAYLLAAAGSIACIILLARVRLRPMADGGQSATAMSWSNLLAGLRFVRTTRVILAAISLDMFAVLFGGATYLLPIFAEDILRVGPRGYGWLNAAPAAGALCMALVLAHRRPMRHAGRNLLVGVAGFGLAIIVFGLSRSFWLSMAMLFLAGALDNISVVVRHTLIQLLTPDSMRGRVSAVNSVFIGISNELGGMESGLVAHWFGPIISVVGGGIGTIAVVLATLLAAPQLGRVGALVQVGAAPGEEPPGGTS